MSLEILNYLKHNSVKSLEQYGVYAKWSSLNKNKFSLNYDQIEAKDDDWISQHCRGLVLEQVFGEVGQAGEYRVLARPFYRFFNFGQPSAAQIDWASAKYHEKLDGTLCILYFDHTLDKWCVATRSVPDADIENNGVTFSELFWRHFNYSTDSLDKGVTYLFELCGPDNRIVVGYENWEVYLLGTFYNSTCEEIGVEHSFPSPKMYPFLGIDDAIKFVNDMPGAEFEGCIVCDKNKNRIKIKNKQYLYIAKIISGMDTDRQMMSSVLQNTFDDIVPYLAEYKVKKLNNMKELLSRKIHQLDMFIDSLDRACERKDIAIRVSDSPFKSWMSAIMDVWSGRYNNVIDWIHNKGGNPPKQSFVDFVLSEISKDI